MLELLSRPNLGPTPNETNNKKVNNYTKYMIPGDTRGLKDSISTKMYYNISVGGTNQPIIDLFI